MRKFLIVVLPSIFFSQLVFADVLNPPTDPGDPRRDRPVLPKIIPGIINPDYKPTCEYSTGEDGKIRFICSDFSFDYCRQYPRSGDCFQIGFREALRERFWCFSPISRCLGHWKNHAFNLVRIPLRKGFYNYCVLEPQKAFDPDKPETNPLIVCFIKPDTWDPLTEPLPPDVIDIICLYYATWGFSCEYLPHIKVHPGDQPIPGQPVSPAFDTPSEDGEPEDEPSGKPME